MSRFHFHFVHFPFQFPDPFPVPDFTSSCAFIIAHGPWYAEVGEFRLVALAVSFSGVQSDCCLIQLYTLNCQVDK